MELNVRAVIQAIEALERRVSQLAAGSTSVSRIVPKIQAEASVTRASLSKPGHEDQFRFCEEIKNVATTGLEAIRDGDDEFSEVAVNALQKIVEATEARQKLIKMADRSELGWRVVQHYVADPIADNAEDEKRIKVATKAAASEVKAAQEKKGEYDVSFEYSKICFSF